MSKRLIFQNEETGVAAVVVPAPGVDIEAEKAKLIQRGAIPADCETVDETDIPSDRFFRNAWFHDKTAAPQKVGLDLVKCQGIGHDIRRTKRAEKFAPLDIEATIPAQANAAEAARQAVRDQDAQLQIDIDAATDPAVIKQLVEAY